ncbi:hypothetical protein TorRG33x02_180820, partial [Trema orientale]
TYLIDGVSSKESISEKAAEKSEEESCGHVIGYNGGSSVRRKMHEPERYSTMIACIGQEMPCSSIS